MAFQPHAPIRPGWWYARREEWEREEGEDYIIVCVYRNRGRLLCIIPPMHPDGGIEGEVVDIPNDCKMWEWCPVPPPE